MLDVFLDCIIDTLKIIPFLFLSYLVIEYIEHKHLEKLKKLLSNNGLLGGLIGSTVGIIPQCGFGSAAASLYSGRLISIGTLFAVFLATSDEAIPVLIANGQGIGVILKLAITKFVIACIVGTVIDLVYNKIFKNVDKEKEQQEHIHDVCHNCDCEHGILKSSINHTLEIITYVFVISLVVNVVIELIGQSNFERIILKGSIFQPFATSLVALIPNCAASVILTELYINGSISFGAIIAGLLSNAGVGMIILFKNNKNKKENISIMLGIYFIGVIIGTLIQLIF